MKIEVDWSLCDGNGVCALEAPDHFELDDDDELQILEAGVSADEQASVERAVVGCPKHAITLAD